MFAEIISPIGDGVFLKRFQLIQYLFHAFDSRLMFVVVAKHFEDDFEERKKVFFGLKLPQLATIPHRQNVSVDAPDDVVEEVGKKSHQVL